MKHNRQRQPGSNKKVIAIGIAVGLLSIVGASPAFAASCTARGQGGVNSNGSHWVRGNDYYCAGDVRARTIRLNGATPPTYTYGPWASTSTATSPTSGTSNGGGVYSNAGSPVKYATHNYTDATWRSISFSW